MIDNQSLTVYSFPMRMLIQLSVDEILLLRYENELQQMVMSISQALYTVCLYVLLFYGISTFNGYVMSNPPFEKNSGGTI